MDDVDPEDDDSYELPAKGLDTSKYKPEWTAWIAERYGTYQQARWMCQMASDAMVGRFSELRQVRGIYLRGGYHWWCVDQAGNVVDPTAAQYDPTTPEELIYQEMTDAEVDAMVPSGKCQHCGDSVYRKQGFCSTDCAEASARFMEEEERAYLRQ